MSLSENKRSDREYDKGRKEDRVREDRARNRVWKPERDRMEKEGERGRQTDREFDGQVQGLATTLEPGLHYI